MSDLLVMLECARCLGTGVQGSGFPTPGPGTQTCIICEGSGEIIVGNAKVLSPILDDIIDKINDVQNKCNDIFEQVST